MGFPGGLEVKAPASNTRDLGSIPGSGKSPGEGNGNPFQYSCLENSVDREAWPGYDPWVHKELDMTEQSTAWHGIRQSLQIHAKS